MHFCFSVSSARSNGGWWSGSSSGWHPRTATENGKKNDLEQKIVFEVERIRTKVVGVDVSCLREHEDMCRCGGAQPTTPQQFDGSPAAQDERTHCCQGLHRTRRPSARNVDHTDRRTAQLKHAGAGQTVDQAIGRNAELRQKSITTREQLQKQQEHTQKVTTDLEEAETEHLKARESSASGPLASSLQPPGQDYAARFSRDITGHAERMVQHCTQALTKHFLSKTIRETWSMSNQPHPLLCTTWSRASSKTTS